MNPLVSIIVPTYNVEELIIPAINSIKNQKGVELEILVQDGLSRDKTMEIIESLSDERFSVYSEKDKGIYDAMNMAIRKAKGTWVYFMGADDRLKENALRDLFAEAVPNEVDVLYGQVWETNKNRTMGEERSLESLMEFNLHHQAMFFRKSLYEKIGYYEPKYKIRADYVHNMAIFSDKEVKTLFRPVIIADYANTGLSARNMDAQFVADQEEILRSNFTGKVSAEREALIPLIAEEHQAYYQLRHGSILKGLFGIVSLFIRRKFYTKPFRYGGAWLLKRFNG